MIPTDPLSISLYLQGANILANLGANYFDRNQEKDASQENKRRLNLANVQRALGGNPIYQPVQPESTGRAKLLRNLGQAAGLGSQAIGQYGDMKSAADTAAQQTKLIDLQIGQILGETAGMAAPLSNMGNVLGEGQQGAIPDYIANPGAQRGPQGMELLRRVGQAGVQYPSSISGNEFAQNVFDATIQDRRAGEAKNLADMRSQDIINQLRQAKIQNLSQPADAGPTYSGANVMQMARETGSNVALMNPLADPAAARAAIMNHAKANGIAMDSRLMESAVAGFNESAKAIRADYVGALDGAVKVAVDQGYEAGLLTLQSNLGTKYGEGFQISESLLGTYLDRLDAANDALNLDGSTRKRLVEMMAIRENALNAIDKLTNDKVYEQIKANFGRDSGAVAKALSFFQGEAKVIGDDAASFLNQLGFLTDTVARFRSGAALTESEQTFYGKLIGSLYTQPEDLRLNLQGLVNQMDREINITLSVGGKKRLSDFNG